MKQLNTNYTKAVTLLLIICFSCMSSQSKLDCARFHKGKFLLNSDIDNTKWIIIREDTIQTETDQTSGIVTKSRITWTSDCEYQLLRLNNLDKPGDSLASAYRRKLLFTKIIAATRNYYVFTSHKEGHPNEYSDTLWVLKE